MLNCKTDKSNRYVSRT